MKNNWDLEIFVTPGLGDNSYLLCSGKEAAVIDPQRDAWRFLSAAEKMQLRVTYAVETHVHNDYVSGAMELRHATRATILAPAKGRYEFDHQAVAEGDEIKIGDVRLVCLETPGHTPDHLCWLVYPSSEDEPAAIFTGGSLIVGSAGRTDLLGSEWTDRLTRMQYHSVRRIARYPLDAQILPTHGAGSFCTAARASQDRSSTLRHELEHNPALQIVDIETFVNHQLSGLSAYPTYYHHMAPVNRRGPKVHGRLPQIASLSAEEFDRFRRQGTWMVDLRDRKAFASQHIPGSINIELEDNFAVYAGWFVPFEASLMFILPDHSEDSRSEAALQLFRIGYENINGYLTGGISAWQQSGRPTTSYPAGTVNELCADLQKGTASIVDVRQDSEWESEHVDGSHHLFVGDLPAKAAGFSREGNYWVACASGFRAAIAASYLHGQGYKVKLLQEGGVQDVIGKCDPVVENPSPS